MYLGAQCDIIVLSLPYGYIIACFYVPPKSDANRDPPPDCAFCASHAFNLLGLQAQCDAYVML